MVAAGCGGGGSAGTATANAPAPPAPDQGTLAVRVQDGDRGTPVAGARVVAFRSDSVVGTAATDAAGRADVPAGTRLVEVREGPVGRPGVRARRARERGALRPRPPEPGVRRRSGAHAQCAGRVRGSARRPAGLWTFESRTLIEFPPAVDNGLVVVGVNSGRVYGLNAGTGRIIWARRREGRDRLESGDQRRHRAHLVDGRGADRLHARARHAALAVLHRRQPGRELAPGGRRTRVHRHLERAAARGGRRNRPA